MDAQETYGAGIDATDAIPVPAVVAEMERYLGHRVTVDGRISEVVRDGCTLQMETNDSRPLQIDASQQGDGSCTWQVSTDVDGFAVAAGLLRMERDTLRLSANGVQVTPVQVAGADS